MEKNLEMIKEEVAEKQNEKHERNLNFYRKLISGVVAIFVVIFYFVIKNGSPDATGNGLLLTMILLIVLCTIVFFWTNIQKIWENKESKMSTGLPAPASLGELRALAADALTNEYFANHTCGCDKESMKHLGKGKKEAIYVYRTKALYREDMKNGEVVILIHSHFPLSKRSILIDPSEGEITRAANELCSEPEDEPDVIERESSNAILGTTEKIKEYKKSRELEAKEDKKEGDLE